jgi:nucleoside-diphosphate-sugar epimerase
VAPVALITGASGLIGRHVVEQWDIDGLRARAVDHARNDLLQPGAAAALVEREQPAVVVHLAWAASGTPGYRHSADNDRWLRTSLELAQACEAVGAALVATGTSLDRARAPADPYSVSKVRLWKALQPAVAAGALTWVRPYYVVDPARRRPALIEHALAAQAAGVPVVLHTPESEHDFIHAADVAGAIVLAVRRGLRGELPIGSGRLRRVCDLVAALGIAWEAGHESAGPASGHVDEVADTRRLRGLGWTPARTIELFEGMQHSLLKQQ